MTQPSSSAPVRTKALRWGGLVVLSAVLTTALEVLHLPAALLLGPMGAAIVLALRGANLALPPVALNLSQGIVGLLIATLLPPTMLAEVAAQWPVIAAGTLFTILVSAALGWAVSQSGILPGTTGIWGAAPGAAMVMTVMSQDYGADIRLVAFMQYLRVACVAVAATLVARLFGVTPGPAPSVDWFPALDPVALAVTIALAAALAFAGVRFRLPGGSFLLPIFGGLAFVHGAGVPIILPPWLLALSYACIGWSIGLRFTPAIIGHAARAFPQVMAAILTLILVCGGAAAVLVRFAGIDPMTAYLATSPGGADSVAIISASTPVDVPFVMAMQMSRFLLVLFTGPWLARLLSGRKARALPL